MLCICYVLYLATFYPSYNGMFLQDACRPDILGTRTKIIVIYSVLLTTPTCLCTPDEVEPLETRKKFIKPMFESDNFSQAGLVYQRRTLSGCQAMLNKVAIDLFVLHCWHTACGKRRILLLRVKSSGSAAQRGRLRMTHPVLTATVLQWRLVGQAAARKSGTQVPPPLT